MLNAVISLWFLFCAASIASPVDPPGNLQLSYVGHGWSKNSVNSAIFRKSSITSDANYQFTAFYDAYGRIVVAKRKLGSYVWESKTTSLVGDIDDAHNTISIALDGAGFLHVAWGMHGSPMQYATSLAPGTLAFTAPTAMTGTLEEKVTYPEFHRLPSGDLLFFYRHGFSSNGRLVLNRFDNKNRRWSQLHRNLISGEGERSAYWQIFVDDNGWLHLSWVWRENQFVESNHDIGYAVSRDGGRVWYSIHGSKYELPIVQSTTNYAARIPENSGLINTTSMTVDHVNRPIIATYWRPADSDVPQYFLIYFDGEEWKQRQVGTRFTPFDLGGAGTKSIPISRPQIVTRKAGPEKQTIMIFRDDERGGKVSVAIGGDISTTDWRFYDLTENSVDRWEPSFDLEMWRNLGELHIFVQKTGQGDSETLVELSPQPVFILEWAF